MLSCDQKEYPTTRSRCYKHSGYVRKRAWSAQREGDKQAKRTLTDFSYFPQLALQKDMVCIVMSMLGVETLYAVLHTCKAARGWFDNKIAQKHLLLHARHIYPSSPFLHGVDLVLQPVYCSPYMNTQPQVAGWGKHWIKDSDKPPMILPNIKNLSVHHHSIYELNYLLRNFRFNNITKLEIVDGNFVALLHNHVHTQLLRMNLLVLSNSDLLLSVTQLNKVIYTCSTAVFHQSSVLKQKNRWPDEVFPALKNLYTDKFGGIFASHFTLSKLERLCLTGCNMLRREDWQVIEKTMPSLRMLGLMVYDSSLSTSIQAPLECITPILPRLTHLYFHVGLYVFSPEPEEDEDDIVNFLAFEGASFMDYLPYFTHLKVLHWPRFWSLSKEEDAFLHTKMPQLEKSTLSHPYMSLSAFFVTPLYEEEVLDEGLLASREAIRDIGRSTNNTSFHHNPWKWEASLFTCDGKRHSNMNSDDDGYMSNGECVCG